MNPWVVGVCAYLVTLAVLLAFNHGAHRNPTPKPEETETRTNTESSGAGAAS